MSETTPSRPRRIATIGRVAVIAGSGLALGALSAHVQADALADRAAEPTASVPAGQRVVTIVREIHVGSDPVIVHRTVPPGSDDDDGTSSGPSSNAGPSRSIQAAPAPAPAAGPPAATSTAS